MESDNKFYEFCQVIAKLRARDGCPWDREQTHESLKSCMLEEAYEVIEAIDRKDDENLQEELGDVLFQVIMHARIAQEEDRFTIDDVLDEVSAKMIRRHPHIFGDVQVETTDEVLDNWERIKQNEKQETDLYEGLTHVPKALPANIRAAKVQKKAAMIGYEFESLDQVTDKVDEELNELKNAIKTKNPELIDEEFGDLMFTMINLSRFLHLNAENSLTNAIEKFINRLGSVEKLAKSRALVLSSLSPQQLDGLWIEVKNNRTKCE